MSGVWLTAWAISILTYGGGYVGFRRCGFTRVEALTLAAPFFPAPLFIGIGGSNSFVYLVDLFTPWFILLALARRSAAPAVAGRAALTLFIGVGLIPLLVTGLAEMGNRPRLMYAMINAYRVTGICALLILASVARVTRREQFYEARFIAGFSWMVAVLAGAVVLQYSGVLDSNVFYAWDATRAGPDGLVGATAVAGLFRGSLGIMALFGLIGFLATRGGHGFQEALGLIGAAAALAMIVIIGSKTSLLLAVLLCGIGTIRAFRSGGRKLGYLLLLIALSGLTGLLFIDRLPAKYVERLVGVFSRSDASMDTLQFRQSRWAQSFETLQQNPEILLGLGLEGGMDVNLGFYHNEYLAMLMNGGVFSFGAYALFLLIVGIGLLKNYRSDRPAVVFALMALLAGIVQGITVDHIMPGLYFASTAALFATCYGLGLNPAALINHDDEWEAHSLVNSGAYYEEIAYERV